MSDYRGQEFIEDGVRFKIGDQIKNHPGGDRWCVTELGGASRTYEMPLSRFEHHFSGAISMTTNLWESNEIQFPRLIAEIAATIRLTKRQRADLAESMDLNFDEIDEIFERAQQRWEEIKEMTVPVEVKVNMTARRARYCDLVTTKLSQTQFDQCWENSPARFLAIESWNRDGMWAITESTLFSLAEALDRSDTDRDMVYIYDLDTGKSGYVLEGVTGFHWEN